MMKNIPLSLLFIAILFCACNKEEATQYERTTAVFVDSLGGNISTEHWWRTSVTLNIHVTTDSPTQLWLLFSSNGRTWLCDYKETSASGIITMTAPQGQCDNFTLSYMYKNKVFSQDIVLSGKPEEFIQVDTSSSSNVAKTRGVTPPASLSGSSINGDAKYYQFSSGELSDYFKMMNYSKNNVDAKVQGLNTNYELESNGPFYITWVNGYEQEQRSRILGYYYHSAYTYDDIKYVDLSETHKWDYIDGLSKVQYQINTTETIDGYLFEPKVWYDANFDMDDYYGSKKSLNMDRIGDNAYNSQVVYNHFKQNISALRGISFLVDVPVDKRIGFYLRSEEEPMPTQWDILNENGISPYIDRNNFKGACYCVESMNIEGNERGKHRSFVQEFDEVIWMGMEDLLDGGDHDCNDVIFGVVADVKIQMPDIVDPKLIDNPNIPDPSPAIEAELMPWTIAYEDVNRNPDFDFNDCVIKVIPDYENERCCVWMMAAGSTSRMYLHYNGPNGDTNMGEIHELFGSSNNQTYINTNVALANKGFVQIDCVPWPKGYTMANDAQRFYIEIQRGTCDDCTDVITLAQEPGKMPEALLVAGEWHWPMEGTNIVSAYKDFSGWARDATRMRFWEWYKTPEINTSVLY